jgi:putative membrane protein
MGAAGGCVAGLARMVAVRLLTGRGLTLCRRGTADGASRSRLRDAPDRPRARDLSTEPTMTDDRKPERGSKSETMSAIKDTLGGLAGETLAATVTSAKSFAKHATIATIYEIEAAKIALKRAHRADVKDFAQQMIEDHTKMGSELGSFLGTIPTMEPPKSLDTVHQTLIDDLNGADDEHFDHRYLEQQRLAHGEALTLFKTYRDRGDDSGLRNLCKLALPVLEHHAEMADTLAAR